MIGLLALSLLAGFAEPPDNVQIAVSGRDYTTLNASTETFRGLCDGREASLTIEKAYRGQAGRLVLRYEQLSRELPANFLEGRLVSGSYYAAGLGCDGRRLRFLARVAQIASDGTVNLRVQHATMDLRTGDLSVSQIRTMTPEEVRYELR